MSRITAWGVDGIGEIRPGDQLGEIVAPELQPDRFGHAESVDVHDAAAHGELRDIFDHLDLFEADRHEVVGERLETPDLTTPKFESRRGERFRDAGAFQHRARSGEQDPHAAAGHPLERLERRRARAERAWDYGLYPDGLSRQLAAVTVAPGRRAALRTVGVPALSVFEYNSKVPSSTQWQAGVQMSLPFSSSLDVSYVGQHGFNRLAAFQGGSAIDVNAVDFGTAYLPAYQDTTKAASATPGANALTTNLLRPYRKPARPIGRPQRRSNTRSQTPWPRRMPRFSNLVRGR